MAVSVSYSQTNTGKQFQNRLSVDAVNDNFLPPYQDFYYTNGVHLGYSRLVSNDFLFPDILPAANRKQILRFKLGQEIYTPHSIEINTAADIDRPYAGYLFISSTLDTFWERQHNLKLALTLGVIGPSSGGEWVQKKWHSWFGYIDPEGWQFQIQDMPVVNFNMDYKYSFSLFSGADIITSTGLRAGTAFNDLSAGAKLRLGNINPISFSAATASQLQQDGKKRLGENEWYFFLGLDNAVVLHNALIEGNAFANTKRSYIKKGDPYLLTISGGFSYSLPFISLKLVMNQLSPEVAGGRRHNFVNISMAVRF